MMEETESSMNEPSITFPPVRSVKLRTNGGLINPISALIT